MHESETFLQSLRHTNPGRPLFEIQHQPGPGPATDVQVKVTFKGQSMLVPMAEILHFGRRWEADREARIAAAPAWPPRLNIYPYPLYSVKVNDPDLRPLAWAVPSDAGDRDAHVKAHAARFAERFGDKSAVDEAIEPIQPAQAVKLINTPFAKLSIDECVDLEVFVLRRLATELRATRNQAGGRTTTMDVLSIGCAGPRRVLDGRSLSMPPMADLLAEYGRRFQYQPHAVAWLAKRRGLSWYFPLRLLDAIESRRELHLLAEAQVFLRTPAELDSPDAMGAPWRPRERAPEDPADAYDVTLLPEQPRSLRSSTP